MKQKILCILLAILLLFNNVAYSVGVGLEIGGSDSRPNKSGGGSAGSGAIVYKTDLYGTKVSLAYVNKGTYNTGSLTALTPTAVSLNSNSDLSKILKTTRSNPFSSPSDDGIYGIMPIFFSIGTAGTADGLIAATSLKSTETIYRTDVNDLLITSFDSSIIPENDKLAKEQIGKIGGAFSSLNWWSSIDFENGIEDYLGIEYVQKPTDNDPNKMKAYKENLARRSATVRAFLYIMKDRYTQYKKAVPQAASYVDSWLQEADKLISAANGKGNVPVDYFLIVEPMVGLQIQGRLQDSFLMSVNDFVMSVGGSPIIGYENLELYMQQNKVAFDDIWGNQLHRITGLLDWQDNLSKTSNDNKQTIASKIFYNGPKSEDKGGGFCTSEDGKIGWGTIPLHETLDEVASEESVSQILISNIMLPNKTVADTRLLLRDDAATEIDAIRAQTTSNEEVLQQSYESALEKIEHNSMSAQEYYGDVEIDDSFNVEFLPTDKLSTSIKDHSLALKAKNSTFLSDLPKALAGQVGVLPEGIDSDQHRITYRLRDDSAKSYDSSNTISLLSNHRMAVAYNPEKSQLYDHKGVKTIFSAGFNMKLGDKDNPSKILNGAQWQWFKILNDKITESLMKYDEAIVSTDPNSEEFNELVMENGGETYALIKKIKEPGLIYGITSSSSIDTGGTKFDETGETPNYGIDFSIKKVQPDGLKAMLQGFIHNVPNIVSEEMGYNLSQSGLSEAKPTIEMEGSANWQEHANLDTHACTQ